MPAPSTTSTKDAGRMAGRTPLGAHVLAALQPGTQTHRGRLEAPEVPSPTVRHLSQRGTGRTGLKAHCRYRIKF